MMETSSQLLVPFQSGEFDFEVVEGSRFVVSRTAFRDNSSHYRINSNKASYKEVADLLRQSGIDLDHNRFLILQVSLKTCSININVLIHPVRVHHV